MKLIHCSDLHLDCAMERNLTAAQARERNAELCATFGRIVDYAVKEGVRAVLIAGDLFDTRWPDAQTEGFVLERIRGAEQVDFLILRGNHDAMAFERAELSNNMKIFGPDWTYYRYGDTVIAGAEPESAQWEAFWESLDLPKETVNLVMLHGQVSTRPGTEQIPLGCFRNRHIDYLALGHIHAQQSGRLDDRGQWCYCGCPEGRGFDECGEKGFMLLEVGDGKVSAEFIPFAGRTLHEVDVDISELRTVDAIRTAMERESARIPQKDLVKFVLRGSFEPDTQKDLRFLRKQLEGRFYAVKIADETTLRIDPESYAHDASLKGEFIRVVMASGRPREEQERIILLGLRALSGEEVDA